MGGRFVRRTCAVAIGTFLGVLGAWAVQGHLLLQWLP